MIGNAEKLFASDLLKYEVLLTASYVSAELVCELADKELAKAKLLEGEENLVKLSGDLISTGKISIPLFKRILTFLYAACKMSEDIAVYLRESHKELLDKMMSTLVKKEVEDYELLSDIAGVICSSIQNLQSIDKGAATEILNTFHKIITKTLPAESFFNNIDALLKRFDQEKEEAKVEEIRKNLNQAAIAWTSEANANSIVLEVVAELFTSEEVEEEEDMRMEEEEGTYVETMADSLLDTEFVNAIIKRCVGFITNSKHSQLRSLRETSSVCKAAEKLRSNAFSCLLNLVLNRSKKIVTNENLKKLILDVLKEVVSNSTEEKHNYLKEHISTFVKVSFERLNDELHLETTITQSDLSIILTGIQTITNEKIQENIITILGILLKSIPHTLEFNKECCTVLLGLALKGSLGLTTAVLNAIFDIYSEENYNDILKELGVMKILSENTTNYKTLVTI